MPMFQRPQGLMAQQQPDTGGLMGGDWLSGAQSWREANPGVLGQLGAGLMSGNLAGGFQNASALQAKAGERQRIVKYLLDKGIAKSPDEAIVLASDSTLLSRAMKAASGGVDYSQIPQYFKKKDGSYGIGVLGDNGTFKEVDLGGNEPLGPYGIALDKATGTAEGKGAGEARDAYDSMTSKLPGLMTVVDQLNVLADKATYTLMGQGLDWARKEVGADPRAEAIARTQYISMVDNQVLPLLRDTFGAQFTAQEGESLRATLGDPNKSPKEKKAVLSSFIEQKKRDIAALALRTGQGSPTIEPPPNSGNGWSVEKVNP